ncbi:IS3 family transposase [Desulfotomaculum defluvii]
MPQTFNENKGRYGYGRITAEVRKKGIIINHKTVLKLMHESNLYSSVSGSSIFWRLAQFFLDNRIPS